MRYTDTWSSLEINYIKTSNCAEEHTAPKAETLSALTTETGTPHTAHSKPHLQSQMCSEVTGPCGRERLCSDQPHPGSLDPRLPRKGSWVQFSWVQCQVPQRWSCCGGQPCSSQSLHCQWGLLTPWMSRALGWCCQTLMYYGSHSWCSGSLLQSRTWWLQKRGKHGSLSNPIHKCIFKIGRTPEWKPWNHKTLREGQAKVSWS